LVGFHGAETGVLLVYDCGGDVDFEALEARREDGLVAVVEGDEWGESLLEDLLF
jgi:hypothetical protein